VISTIAETGMRDPRGNPTVESHGVDRREKLTWAVRATSVATKDYLRVRVGVGRPPGRMDTADFVLRDFGTAEKKELPFLLDDAADAVELLIREGLTAAQQQFHTAKV
jgi:peptidyl-tRNA hydrolase